MSTQKHVLVVDDEPTIRRLVRRLLLADGHHVVEAGSVQEAVPQLGNVDLAVVDICLGDGEAADIVRSAFKLRRPPIFIAMSAGGTREQVAQLMGMGVARYVEKSAIVELPALVANPEDHLGMRALAGFFVGRASFVQAKQTFGRALVEHALSITGGNRGQAADLLRMTRQGLQQLMKNTLRPL